VCVRNKQLFNHNNVALILTFFLLLAPVISFAAKQQPPTAEFKRLLKLAIESDSEFVDKFDAKVWLLDMSNRLRKRAKHIPLKERMSLLKAVHKEAVRARLDPQLVLSVIDIESGFDRFAISKSGARGLMQIMPFWITEIGHDDDNLFDIETNLKYGSTILSLYIKKEKQQLSRALARYNGSQGKTQYPDKVLSSLKKYWLTGD